MTSNRIATVGMQIIQKDSLRVNSIVSFTALSGNGEIIVFKANSSVYKVGDELEVEIRRAP